MRSTTACGRHSRMAKSRSPTTATAMSDMPVRPVAPVISAYESCPPASKGYARWRAIALCMMRCVTGCPSASTRWRSTPALLATPHPRTANMNPLLRPALILAGAILITTSAHAQNAAVVNGKPIPSSRVDEFIQALSQQGRPDTPELRAMVRDELVAQELFVQEAERRGIGNGAEVKRQIEEARRNILMRALVRDEVSSNAVSDAEVRAEYDRLVKQEADKE